MGTVVDIFAIAGGLATVLALLLAFSESRRRVQSRPLSVSGTPKIAVEALMDRRQLRRPHSLGRRAYDYLTPSSLQLHQGDALDRRADNARTHLEDVPTTHFVQSPES